jgi:hypothetical protein
MEWTLRLVGTGTDGQSRSFDVMLISRPDGLGEIANLGLTLTEAKLLLAQVQQQVVAAQAHHHAMFRPDCQSCGEMYHTKGWRPHRIATLFGEVRVKLPRLACAGCGCGETGLNWPSHCRSTPGLDELGVRTRRCSECPARANGWETQVPVRRGLAVGSRRVARRAVRRRRCAVPVGRRHRTGGIARFVARTGDSDRHPYDRVWPGAAYPLPGRQNGKADTPPGLEDVSYESFCDFPSRMLLI